MLSLLLSLALSVGSPVFSAAEPLAAVPQKVSKTSARAVSHKSTHTSTKKAKKSPTKKAKKAAPPAKVSVGSLIIPVAGIAANKLSDSYYQRRSKGRTHRAIDIMAPQNTPVLAAASGTVVRMYENRLGGTCMYVLSEDKKVVYYYAHLDHYAENVEVGQEVAQGQLLAYVGDTGNAPPGAYHLHFSISRLSDPKRFWDGSPANPYPLLKKAKSVPLEEVEALQESLGVPIPAEEVEPAEVAAPATEAE